MKLGSRSLGRGSMALPESWAKGAWGLAFATSALGTLTRYHRYSHLRSTIDENDGLAEEIATDAAIDAAPMMSHPPELWVHLVAGGASGALSKTVMAPLARLTILYQVSALGPAEGAAKPGLGAAATSSSSPPGMLTAMRGIVKSEGMAALWRGNWVTILHRVPYSAVNFATFEASKQHLETHIESDVVRRLASGAAAGLVACTAAYPLDLVRTRLAAQRGRMPEGSCFALPRRVPASAAAAAAAALAHPSASAVVATPLSPAYSATASQATAATATGTQSAAGVASQSITSTQSSASMGTSAARAATHSAASTSQPTAPAARHPQMYRGMTHALSTIMQAEGWRGLYRGLGATLMQVTPALALNFTLYDSFKDLAVHARSPDASGSHTASQTAKLDGSVSQHQAQPSTSSASSSNSQSQMAQTRQQLSAWGSLGCAAAAGFVTSTLTFPLDVVRRRMQVQAHTRPRGSPPPPTTYLAMVRHIAERHGWRGFYAGILPEYAKVLPGMAIAFTTYEAIKGAAKPAV